MEVVGMVVAFFSLMAVRYIVFFGMAAVGYIKLFTDNRVNSVNVAELFKVQGTEHVSMVS